MHVMYINLKLLFKFHSIWPEIKGHIDIGARTNSKKIVCIDFVLISSDLYIYFNKKEYLSLLYKI